MTPGWWQEIERVFDAALERPEQDRAAFLDEACGGSDLAVFSTGNVTTTVIVEQVPDAPTSYGCARGTAGARAFRPTKRSRSSPRTIPGKGRRGRRAVS
jgi:hypothetical protein